jgi:phosphatidylinositol-3-phosphatase
VWLFPPVKTASESGFRRMPQITDKEISMARFRYVRPLGALVVLAALAAPALYLTFGTRKVKADDDRDDGRDSSEIKHVFVIALENHNWTQPITIPGGIQQIYQNPAAPFINSLVAGNAWVYVNGHLKNISEEVSYATAYHNVLATPSGNNPHIHPSEPNYIWAEAGNNFGVANDADPFATTPPNSQSTTQHLSALLHRAGKTWVSYQEDIDLQKDASGAVINLPLPKDQWTVPIVSLSGKFAPESLLNEYNSTLQYNYAVKHNPQAFFNDTNGGNDTSTSNPLSHNYAPLQQLAFDLAHDRVADYVWITPNQYNDQHSGLTGGFAGLTGDAAMIKQGDNAVSRLVPLIMSSRAYRDGGAIILWWDESEGDQPGDNGDDFNHTIGEIVISRLARQNVNGVPFASTVDFTHSSDLRTMQEIFHVKASGSSPWIGDAANVTDLSDLFEPGVIPTKP